MTTQKEQEDNFELRGGKASGIRRTAKTWFDHFRKNNKRYHANFSMVMGKQWTEDEITALGTLRKNPLKFNKLLPIANYMSGVFQQNTPELEIYATDDTPADVVAVRQAILQNIIFDSDSRQHSQICYTQKMIGGYSARYIYPEYENDNTFDQIIKLTSFADPTKCFWSVDAQHPNKIDSRMSGFVTRMSRDKAAALYGEKLATGIGYNDQGSMITEGETEAVPSIEFWDTESICVLNVFERIYDPFTLHELSNGESIRDDELADLEKIDHDGIEFLMYPKPDGSFDPVKVMRKRRVPFYRVEHSQWAGDYMLDKEDFPSQYSPIVFEDQNSWMDKKGRQITQGFFENVGDSQRMINYLKTQAAYIVSRMRYDQFLVSKENMRSKETQQIWRDPTIVIGALPFDESKSGIVPTQLRPPEIPQTLMLMYESTCQDIYTGTGVYPTQLGQAGTEISGSAIDARRKAGSFTTYGLTNSSNLALNAVGTVINDMMPMVYDTQRQLQLEMPDAGNELVNINQPVDDFGTVKNDMTKGSFKVRVIAGDSLEGQQEADQAAIQLLGQYDPEAIPKVIDLLADTLKSRKKREIVNRLRATMVSPAIVEAGKTGKPLPPQPQGPDPLVMRQQNESMKLQLQAQQNERDFIVKMHGIQLAEQKLELQGHQAGSQTAIQIQELKAEEETEKARYLETQQKLNAEMARIHADVITSGHEALSKVLMHSPRINNKTEQ